jgi:hypothetical protein
MPYGTASPLVNITDEDIDRAIGVALASSGGGLSAKSPKLTLTHAPEGGVYEPAQIRANEKYFKALDPEGATQAEVLMRFLPDNVARVEDILQSNAPRELGRGGLGPSALRDLLAQFRSQHPEVSQITGRRVSGAATGGQYDLTPGAGREASIPLRPVPTSQFALPKSNKMKGY